MLSVVFLLFLFSVNLEFSYQKKIQTNLRTKVELFQKKYDFILTEVVNINNDIENIWEIVNDTRNMLDTNDVKMINKAEHISKQLVRNETLQCPRDFSDKLNRIEKYIQDEKQATRKRWFDKSSLIDRKRGEIMDIVKKISTDQVTVRTNQDSLRIDIDTLRADHNKLRTDIDELRADRDKTSIDQVELRTDQETLRTDINTLRADRDKLRTDINELRTGHDTTSTDQVTLRTYQAKLRTDIDKLRADQVTLGLSFSQKLQLTQTDWVKHGTSIYKYFSDSKTWMDAMRTCNSITYNVGYLIEISDVDELNFVTNLVPNIRNYWTGGCDLDIEGSWKWCGTGSSMYFTNWRDGEPNNSGHNQEPENCLYCYKNSPEVVEKKGECNDGSCIDKTGFVCEVPIS